MIPSWPAQLTDDKRLVISNRDAFTAWKAQQKPGEYSVTITRQHRKRTLPQNNLYWLRCQIIGDFMGHDREAVHEILMHRCEFHDQIKIMDRVDFIRWSSRNLTTVQFSKLMDEQDNLAAWISDTNGEPFILPTPEDRWL